MNKYLDESGLDYLWGKIKNYAVKRITSTDNAIVKFNGTTGDVLNSGITIDDNNVITTPGDIILKNSSNGAATPKIEFRRGSNSDSYNDWIISSDSSGRFIVSLKATSSSNKVILTSSGVVFANSLEASSIKKTDGTSSLFLKADGSVDNTSYLPLAGGTMTGNLGVNGNIALSGNVELNNATLYENGNISTLGGFIKSGGTSSLFLKADGSVDSSNYAGSQSAGGPANKTVSIPFGQVDSNSTATAFTATVDGITELRDGICIYLRNGVIDSDSGYTININNLGAKSVYNAFKGTATSGMFSSDSTFLFVYNSSRISGGCWDAVTGYYESDTNNIGYYIRTNSQTLPVSDRTAKYRILFTSADGTKYVPANSTTHTNATSKRDTCQTPINPFGNICIYYNSSNTSISAGTIPSASILWQQRNVTLGYSFNWTGSALTLTDNAPVYLKCIPQTNGSAKMATNANIPIVQSLPTTDDGKIYIFLGNATSATTIELMLNHPVYYYKNGAIRLWTGPV